MARVGSFTTQDSFALKKILASDKVAIIDVNYKEKHSNTRLVRRSGRRNGNDVYIDVIRIPKSVRVRFKEDQTVKEIYLFDGLFIQYIDGKITKQEYIEKSNNANNIGCIILVIIIGIICLFQILS